MPGQRRRCTPPVGHVDTVRPGEHRLVPRRARRRLEAARRAHQASPQDAIDVGDRARRAGVALPAHVDAPVGRSQPRSTTPHSRPGSHASSVDANAVHLRHPAADRCGPSAASSPSRSRPRCGTTAGSCSSPPRSTFLPAIADRHLARPLAEGGRGNGARSRARGVRQRGLRVVLLVRARGAVRVRGVRQQRAGRDLRVRRRHPAVRRHRLHPRHERRERRRRRRACSRPRVSRPSSGG